MDTLTILLRMSIALLAGGLIGLERERKNMPAGFRTHILVCLGASLVMMTSKYILDNVSASIEVDRMGAQVISGIGFLGAGTILRHGINVKGLTTAASLWATACIGLAIGIGFIEGAIIGTGIIYITLIVLGLIEGKLGTNMGKMRIKLLLSKEKLNLKELDDFMEKNKFIMKKIDFIKNKDKENRHELIIDIEKIGPIKEIELVKRLEELDGVINVSFYR